MEPFPEIPVGILYWYVATLDGLPEGIRAMVAGSLLVILLRLSHARVSGREVQFSIAFAKTSFIALVVIPLMVWLLPQSRVGVFVDKLELHVAAVHTWWQVLLVVWSLGFVVGGARLVSGYACAVLAYRRLAPVAVDHQLARRMRHWQRRLGIPHRLALAFADADHPGHCPGARRVVVPRALLHWPAPAQDLVIIQQLCHRKKNHGRWHLFAGLMVCCYWPLPWVRRLQARLLQDFDVVTDKLAEACYEDELGYRRALRQIEQRMVVPGSGAGAGDAGTASVATSRLARGLYACRRHLAALWSPHPFLDWSVGSLTAAHHRRRDVVWTEPGEKLALMVGQAVFVAAILGGVTFKQMPPAIERDYSVTLDASWMKTAFRNPDDTAPRAR